MSQRRPTSLAEISAVATTMASSPAQAVQMGAELGNLARNLPPPRSELLTRPYFERGTLWSLGTSFEFLPNDGTEVTPQIIRLQHDVWIRGVESVGVLGFTDDGSQFAELFFLGQRFGVGNRWLFELNWRVDARQGFISEGQAEVLSPANTITGDGRFSAPLDWKLQKDQTIEVRCRSRLANILGPDLPPPVAGEPPPVFLRWVVVNFYAEEIAQPGAR